MNAGRGRFDGGVDGEISSTGGEMPLQAVGLPNNFFFAKVLQGDRDSFVPENGFAEEKAEGHVVDEGFESAGGAVRLRKIGVHPAPEGAMAVAAVVTLDAEAEGIAGESVAVENDLARKNGVGMGRLRETDPPLVAEGGAEVGAVTKIPGEGMTIDEEVAPAGVFVDAVFGDATMKRKLKTSCEIELLERETLNESARRIVAREPGGPDLDRQSGVFRGAAVATEIGEQVAKPPGAGAVGEAAAQEPNLVAAFHGTGRVDGVELGIGHEGTV